MAAIPNPNRYLGADAAAPAGSAEAVTPHDVNELTYITRGLYIGVGGDVTVVMYTGETVLHSNVPGGSILPLAVKQVKSTGTTASSIVAWS